MGEWDDWFLIFAYVGGYGHGLDGLRFDIARGALLLQKHAQAPRKALHTQQIIPVKGWVGR